MADEINEFRVKFFEACRNTEFETQQLTSTLDLAEQEKPQIFEEHVDADYLHETQLRWDDGFFERCAHESMDVFSRCRLDHLLAVRDYLRNTGVRGFKPAAKKTERKNEMANTQFQPTENLRSNFQDVVSNLLQAQIALRFELYDISMDSDYLKGAVSWAESKAADLFAPYETSNFNKAISKNEQDWSADYFDIQTEYLSANFSKERYLHLIGVRQYLRDKGVEGFVAAPRQKTVSSAEPQKPKQATPKASKPASRSDSISRALRTALMVGGAIAALLVLVFSITR